MNDHPDLPWLRELVSHRYVVELLDTLAAQPSTAFGSAMLSRRCCCAV